MWKMSAIHIELDNMTSLSYLLKMGGTKNPELIQISKEIWEFLLVQGITITAGHSPGNLNCKADWESRHHSSEWKLCPLIFSKIWQVLGKKPEIDLFASRLSNQLPSYYYWKPDHDSLGTDALQQKWYQNSISIPSICLDSQSTEKSRGGESAFSNNSNSNLAEPKLVSRALTSFSEKTNHFATKGRFTRWSSKPTASSYSKSNNATSSVGCLRKRLAEEGICRNVPNCKIENQKNHIFVHKFLD